MRSAAIGAVAALVAGCSSQSGAEMVVPELGAFASSAIAMPAQGGVALLGIEYIDLTCADVRVVVGTGGPGGYAPTLVKSINSQFGNREDTAVLPLPAGSYNLLQVACRNGNHVTVLGPNGEPGSIPWKGGSWPNSIAQFEVGRGQVSDLGLLSIVRKHNKGFEQTTTPAATLSLGQRSDTSRARFAKAQPDLAPREVASGMTLSGGTRFKLSKCKLTASAEAEAKAKAAPLPSGDVGDRLSALSAKEPPATSCQPVAADKLG